MNMTSELNLEDIYTELNNLLKDVCSFLTNEAQNGTLSAKAKNEAEKLVSRSRQQVDIVTKLSVIQESSNPNYPYLEMQRPGEAEDPLSEYVPAEITDYYEPEHYEESYAPVDNEPSISTPPPPPPPSSPTVNGEFCLYSDLPLNMIEEKSVKFGPLCRKERYLFLEQKKQYMAGLVGYWLLIYACNKRDNKPLQMINLLNYSAKAIEQRKDPAFEICAENEKAYEFIARSIKDMEQWVVAINCKKHICTNGRNLPEIPSTTNSEELDNLIRNSDQTNSDNQNVMHYGSEEDIYASVEDFGKPNIPKPLPAPAVEDFPKLPPRSTKELPSLPKRSTLDNTYNNLQKTETEENKDDDDTNSEYYFVQSPDTENEEEQLEIYDEVKVTETINTNVIKPFISNTNTPQENYDSVDTREEEELENYDTVKPSKIPIKINVPPQNNAQEDEEIADYDEIYVPSRLKPTLKKTQRDEVLETYDAPKPTTSKQPTQVSPENRPEDEEILEDYDFLKPVPQYIQSKQNQPHSTITKEAEKEEEYTDHDVLNPTPENKLNTSVQITTPPDDTDNTKLSQTEQIDDNSKKSENNNDTKPAKPIKPIKKFWEKRLSSESPKKETSDAEDESKLSVANIKTKLNAQLLLNVQDKNKPPIKPKTQMLLNKFPSFSKNKNSKDDDGNSKMQNIRQQLEHTFRNKNN